MKLHIEDLMPKVPLRDIVHSGLFAYLGQVYVLARNSGDFHWNPPINGVDKNDRKMFFLYAVNMLTGDLQQFNLNEVVTPLKISSYTSGVLCVIPTLTDKEQC